MTLEMSRCLYGVEIYAGDDVFIRGGRWYARMCVCLYIARGMVQTAELLSDDP